MKKIKIAVFLTVAILALTGCKQATNESESKKKESSTTETKKESIVYTAVVKEDGAAEKGGILVKDITPVDSKNTTPPVLTNDVILITDGTNLLNAKTKEKVDMIDVKSGMTVKITLAKEPVSTMSLPPQIPGKDVYKIVVVE
ncbi:hypothetical protein CKN82_09485 [Carnobacterium divergens]|uniref:Lipoprotein n=2 Tax=Carnobacterium divergens TaxID=2748 RepID=A0A0R2HWJ2_CARDV|nr:hypothetical protein [Carnobacterium divergens]ANZ99884.1 hypothetical protein BFC22_07125 [Carnobacterium divergens]KRN54250.1 hypothetical protein IV74_GL001830 [Carnobacterium divergens DSM 20623]MDO0873737.1 hypothetical protein [Carnobacterium divergens]MDT1957848.1 hypothetical protein [Carnobacterium divergens]MDT1973851.1 hypothetical protein [Carnobacterium divergens]